MKLILVLTLVLMTSFFSLRAFSVSFDFLHNSPVRYFNDQDWKIFETTADTALNTLPDGKKITWQNPQTGNGGVFQPLDTVKKNGLTCRNLKIFNSAQHRTDQYVFMFCKYSGGWKLFEEDT